MQVEPGTTAELKDFYHHCIPRFILRKFARVVPNATVKSTVLGPELKKAKRKKVRKGLKSPIGKPTTLFFYELCSGSLQDRLLAKVYGKTNLYRDPNNPADVDHLEGKLSVLEHAASTVISRIYTGIQSRTFSVSREELSILRKFIFIMHYRNDAVSSTYFRESSPNNAPLSDWIRNYKKTRHLKTDKDVWLDGLRYYLDTPHHIIVAEGQRLRERYGDHRLYNMLRHGLDPEIEEEYHAIDYENLANYFFLGVWEAAENAEFVLGGNAFGLWEGLIHGAPGAHRLYVVSPRIAIVLRRTFLRNTRTNDPAVLYSCLADISITPPIIKYADEESFLGYDFGDPNVRTSYLSSPKSQQDQFTFGITQLTKSQTYAVNEVVMMNAHLHPERSLTFHSPSAMLNTLKAYMASHNTFLGGSRSLYQPLLQDLCRIVASNSPTIPDSLNVTWNVEADGDFQLHMFLRFAVTNGVSFPSLYNRACLVFHMATDIHSLSNPVSCQIRSIVKSAISRLKFILDPSLPVFIPATSRRPKSVVETLPNEDSEVFFSLVGNLVNRLGVGRHSNDMLANIIYEAGIIGITYWLAANRPDILYDLLFPWITILV